MEQPLFYSSAVVLLFSVSDPSGMRFQIKHPVPLPDFMINCDSWPLSNVRVRLSFNPICCEPRRHAHLWLHEIWLAHAKFTPISLPLSPSCLICEILFQESILEASVAGLGFYLFVLCCCCCCLFSFILYISCRCISHFAELSSIENFIFIL